MSSPILSIVVPALNEEGAIASFIERMRSVASALAADWEIVVVDDGSTDRTREIVEAFARQDPRVRLIPAAHRGKGGAIRRGMLEARGQWRFMADADLSMPADNLARFLTAVDREPPPDVVIGSREAPGAVRVGEPWHRHVIGRVFNRIVRLLAVPDVQDTQCGFKLFAAAAVERIFPRLTIDGFAFDVEALFLAQQAGLDVREVGIVWHARADSRVGLWRGAGAFLDILRIRWRHRGFAVWTYLIGAIFAASIGYEAVRGGCCPVARLQRHVHTAGS